MILLIDCSMYAEVAFDIIHVHVCTQCYTSIYDNFMYMYIAHVVCRVHLCLSVTLPPEHQSFLGETRNGSKTATVKLKGLWLQAFSVKGRMPSQS